MLQKQKRRLARANRKVLLNLISLLTAKRRIRHDNLITVLVLNVGKILAERVGVDNIRRFDPVQDHVHDRNHISERLLLFAIERAGLQSREIFCRQLALRLQIVKRLTKKSRSEE